MKKPKFLSHYLVLRDLIDSIDVRIFNANIVYFTSRIENIKCDLVNEWIEFDENARVKTELSHYKPYILLPNKENLLKARKLLERYATKEVLAFIESINNHKHIPTKTVYNK